MANVARLCDESRPAVVNPRRRGSLPKSIIDRRARHHWVYLDVGDEAVICKAMCDYGRRVRIQGFATADERKRLKLEGLADRWFVVELISGTFSFSDGAKSKLAIMHCKELRRVR